MVGTLALNQAIDFQGFKPGFLNEDSFISADGDARALPGTIVADEEIKAKDVIKDTSLENILFETIGEHQTGLSALTVPSTGYTALTQPAQSYVFIGANDNSSRSDFRPSFYAIKSKPFSSYQPIVRSYGVLVDSDNDNFDSYDTGTEEYSPIESRPYVEAYEGSELMHYVRFAPGVVPREYNISSSVSYAPNIETVTPQPYSAQQSFTFKPIEYVPIISSHFQETRFDTREYSSFKKDEQLFPKYKEPNGDSFASEYTPSQLELSRDYQPTPVQVDYTSFFNPERTQVDLSPIIKVKAYTSFQPVELSETDSDYRLADSTKVIDFSWDGGQQTIENQTTQVPSVTPANYEPQLIDGRDFVSTQDISKLADHFEQKTIVLKQPDADLEYIMKASTANDTAPSAGYNSISNRVASNDNKPNYSTKAPHEDSILVLDLSQYESNQINQSNVLEYVQKLIQDKAELKNTKMGSYLVDKKDTENTFYHILINGEAPEVTDDSVNPLLTYEFKAGDTVEVLRHKRDKAYDDKLGKESFHEVDSQRTKVEDQGTVSATEFVLDKIRSWNKYSEEKIQDFYRQGRIQVSAYEKDAVEGSMIRLNGKLDTKATYSLEIVINKGHSYQPQLKQTT